MSGSKAQSYPYWLRIAVFLLLLPGLITACKRAASTPISPGLSSEIQTQAAAEVPGAATPGTPSPSLPESTQPSTPADKPKPGFPTIQILRSQVGLLRYKPQEWEAVKLGDGMDQIAGVAYYKLVHRSIKGCILQENMERSTPASWSRRVSKIKIGNLSYRQEMWTNTNTEKHVLAVFQYPTKSPAKRYELVMKNKPDLCIRKAKEVLALSEDLVAGP